MMKTETLNQLIKTTFCAFLSFTLRLLDMINSSVFKQVSKMGVTSILVGDGVTLGALRQGLTEFSQNHNTIEKNKKVWRNKYSGKAPSSETDKD